MFGKRKEGRPKRDRSNRGLAQYGLFDIPTNLSFDDTGASIDAGDDSDLEAELLALANSDDVKPKRPPRKQFIPAANLDAMVAESIKDIPSDEELSGDEDPDLLNELSEITGEDHIVETAEPEASCAKESPTDIGKLLEERLTMYQVAEENANAAGETSRARRFGRGVKTLKDLIKQAEAGRIINNDDIPPEVSTKKHEPSEAPKEPLVTPATDPVESPSESPAPNSSIPVSPENAETLSLLTARKDQYKIAALKAKKSGDTATAISFIKIAKQFESVIKAIENEQPVDLSRMPGPPPQEDAPASERSEVQTEGTSTEQEQTEPEPEESEEHLIQASSIAEALQQRLEVYKKQEQAAKDGGNSSKARRMGRIVKQFEQAIKSHNSGKSVPFDELPTPPGYAPIPVPNQEISKPVEPKAPDSSLEEAKARKPPPPARSNSVRVSGNHIATTFVEKQVALLIAQQKLFKAAALNAKQKGEMAQAKEYLRTAKGFDPLIDAAQGGLPVDISSLPVPPSARSQLDNEFDIVMAEECKEDDSGYIDVLSRLEDQLSKQLKMCFSTRDHHKALGDVAGTNRFEQLAVSVTRDLDLVRLAHRTPLSAVPKFHYETKNFSIVKSFTDLGDNDFEIMIVRGINYTCSNAKEVDTYVKFEFPYPQEEPVRNRTATVKDTNNPDYNATFTLPIQRTTRPCLRVFKRHCIKFEVYSKGGFFKGDTLLGTVTVKLQHLETQCELHESYDLLDGRKKVGGKLEVRLRLRHPMLTQQIEQLSEKWLVLDH